MATRSQNHDRAEDLAAHEQPFPTAARERALRERGFLRVAGIDEAGRGCLAGPVVAAAVVLRDEALGQTGHLAAVRDSKLLAPSVREGLFEVIWAHAEAVGVGVAPLETIETEGIVPATRLAMHRAVEGLSLAPDFLLIDYLKLPALPTPQEGIVDGDALCLSIAAASIVAKVSRDRLMRHLDQLYPGYGFAAHKGYGTPQHLRALERLGPCPLHRRTFAPVRAVLDGQGLERWLGGRGRGGQKRRSPEPR